MKDLTLLSPKQMFDKHNIKTHLNDKLHIELPSGATIPIHTSRKSYYVEIDDCLDAAHAAHFEEDSDDLLIHQRCLHFSPQRLAASSSCTKNLLHPNIRLHHKCEPCVRGGMKRPSTSTKRTTGSDDPRRAATKFGDLVYSDTCSLPPLDSFRLHRVGRLPRPCHTLAGSLLHTEPHQRGDPPLPGPILRRQFKLPPTHRRSTRTQAFANRQSWRIH